MRSLFTNYNQAFPTHDHGLGFELDQRRYMGALSSPVTAGHTGFTGTSIVIDPLAHSFVILLTNRVHPTRDWGNNNPSRAAVGTDLALALPVHPKQGRTDWFAGTADDTTTTLTIPVAVPAGGAKLSFNLWYDTSVGETRLRRSVFRRRHDLAPGSARAPGGQPQLADLRIVHRLRGPAVVDGVGAAARP